MQVADLMDPENGRVFLKSENGQLHQGWPCVAFGLKESAEDLRQTFKIGEDVVVSVGATNEDVPPQYKSRLLSVQVLETSRLFATKDLVDRELFNRNRWQHCLAPIFVAQMKGGRFPSAHDLIPTAYRNFPDSRGRFALAEGEEREAVLSLQVVPAHFVLPAKIQSLLRPFSPRNV